MIALLVYLVIGIIVLSFAYWAVTTFCPEPFKKFAYLIMGLVCVILVVYLLLGLVNGGLGAGIHSIR